MAQPIPSRGTRAKATTRRFRPHQTYDDAIPAVVKARADAGKHILVVDMYAPFNPSKASWLEDVAPEPPGLRRPRHAVVLGTRAFALSSAGRSGATRERCKNTMCRVARRAEEAPKRLDQARLWARLVRSEDWRLGPGYQMPM